MKAQSSTRAARGCRDDGECFVLQPSKVRALAELYTRMTSSGRALCRAHELLFLPWITMVVGKLSGLEDQTIRLEG